MNSFRKEAAKTIRDCSLKLKSKFTFEQVESKLSSEASKNVKFDFSLNANIPEELSSKLSIALNYIQYQKFQINSNDYNEFSVSIADLSMECPNMVFFL